jgi:PKD repeat protein
LVTSYSWQLVNANGVSGAVPTSGVGSLPSFTFGNPGNTQQQVVFAVVPVSNGCVGDTVYYTYNVDPGPTVDSIPDQTICSEDAITSVTPTGSVLGTVYSWAVTVPAGIAQMTAFPLAGTGSIPAHQWDNNAVAPVTLTYTITPSAAGCPGLPDTFQVIVNPKPFFNSIPSQTLCSGSSINQVVISSQTSNVDFSWTLSLPNGISGVTTSGTDTIYSQPIANSTNAPITITYQINATYTNNGVSCSNDTILNITVNPIPDMSVTPVVDTICSNTSAIIIASSSVAGTIFNYTASPGPNITGSSGGSGSNINQLLNNTGTFLSSVVYTITPSANLCPGLALTSTIYVEPVPNVVFTPSADTVCTGYSSQAITLSSAVSNVIYQWNTVSNGVNNVSPSSGNTNSVPSWLLNLANPTGPVGNVTITANATINGCPGPNYNAIITVNPLPTPQISAPAIGCFNVPILFTNNTLNGQGYLWNFGDPNSSTNTSLLTSPTHVFSDTGSYTITLVATSAAGCVDSITHNILIVDKPEPLFTTLPDSGCGPLQVQFVNNTDEHNVAVSYNWIFQGGAPPTSTLSNPPPIIFQSGILNDTTYSVQLTATNLCGSRTSTDSVLVLASPVAQLGMSVNSGCSPLTVSFANASYGLPTSYLWIFGNGNTSTSTIPPPQLFTADSTIETYIIMLIATNQCGSDTMMDTLTVYPNTVNSFFNTNPAYGCGPLTVSFTNFTTGATVYSWNFGDGNVSNATSPTHTYAAPIGSVPDTFIVMLAANNGCSYDTSYYPVVVWPQPELSFIASPNPVCAGDTISIVNTSPDALSGISWSFGSSSISNSTSTNPIVVYPNPGTYTITMIGVGAAYSCPDTILQTVQVVALPDAQVSVTPTSGCEPLTVAFNNSTSGAIGHQWNFGDGNSSSLISPSHTYLNAGTYNVTYVAFNSANCTDTASLQVVVHPRPTADFDLSQDSSCIYPVVGWGLPHRLIRNLHSISLDYTQ